MKFLPKTFGLLAMQYFDCDHTWWRLFQKRVVCIEFDIYVFSSARMMRLSGITFIGYAKHQKIPWAT